MATLDTELASEFGRLACDFFIKKDLAYEDSLPLLAWVAAGVMHEMSDDPAHTEPNLKTFERMLRKLMGIIEQTEAAQQAAESTNH